MEITKIIITYKIIVIIIIKIEHIHFRINNNFINKGLNYLLGNENPNNINNKEIIDVRKKEGYDYKKIKEVKEIIM